MLSGGKHPGQVVSFVGCSVPCPIPKGILGELFAKEAGGWGWGVKDLTNRYSNCKMLVVVRYAL